MNSRRYRKRYRPYRSSLRKRARGNQRAANQQRDSTNIVVNTNYSFACGQTMDDPIGNNNVNDFVDSGCAAINIYDVLRKSSYFNQFSTLYDQFKIENIRAKIVATNWVTSKDTDSNNNKVSEIVRSKSYVIVTAWDRSGLSPSQIKKEEWTDDPESHIFTTSIGRNITSYGSAKTKHLGPGNAYEIVRQLYPENAYEKSQFISTKLLVPQQTRLNNYDFTYNCYYYRKLEGEVNGKKAIAYQWDTKYPTNLMSDPSCPFKPTLLVNVIAGPEPQVVEINETDPEGFQTVYYLGVNKVSPVTFDIEFDVSVTFRGLRYNKFNSIPTMAEKVIPKPLYEEPSKILDEANKRGPQNQIMIKDIIINDSYKYKENKTFNAPYANANGGNAIRFEKPKDSDENNYLVYINVMMDNSQPPKPLENILIVKKIDVPDNNPVEIQLENDDLYIMSICCKPDNYINLDFIGDGQAGSVYKCSVPCSQDTWFLNGNMYLPFSPEESNDEDDDMESATDDED